MDLETLLTFALAAAAVLAIPGPTLLFVLANALAGGRRTALATVPGVVLGDATAMTVSLAGAGAVLASSATAFTILKLAGAAYLVWLGIGLWRNPPGAVDPGRAARRAPLRRLFWQSYVVTALNPKSIVFFVAFVPQFVDPARPVLAQFLALEAIFLVLAAVNILVWSLAAGTLGRRIRRPGILRRLSRVGAVCLIGAGLLTAVARRAA